MYDRAQIPLSLSTGSAGTQKLDRKQAEDRMLGDWPACFSLVMALGSNPLVRLPDCVSWLARARVPATRRQWHDILLRGPHRTAEQPPDLLRRPRVRFDSLCDTTQVNFVIAAVPPSPKCFGKNEVLHARKLTLKSPSPIPFSLGILHNCGRINHSVKTRVYTLYLTASFSAYAQCTGKMQPTVRLVSACQHPLTTRLLALKAGADLGRREWPATPKQQLWDDDVGFETKLNPEQLASYARRPRP